MKEIEVKDKQQYLRKNHPFGRKLGLEERKKCIHCDLVFLAGDYKVFKDRNGDEYICCPNAPECEGTVIDWVDVEG
ncbi:hypothetical protein KI659_00005 [Litoribacter alkaliphilus]|uniref:Uncharacterized protein n=2 Tax=Litoribacter ruber TaxID=702568 RepID=A0AAP2CIC9_9BACT|nr:hypothetical protein [Litoribacter alkaliphilus]MBS9522387.1 hypothetical protein [Litoribacter alkaliphilus]